MARHAGPVSWDDVEIDNKLDFLDSTGKIPAAMRYYYIMKGKDDDQALELIFSDFPKTHRRHVVAKYCERYNMENEYNAWAADDDHDHEEVW
jgi:hypothetical protein